MSFGFCCPVCGAPLTAEPHAYRCPSGHCFDRAAKGYVNLLLPNQKNSREPGDDPDCLRARHRFLSGGFYAPLAAQLGAWAAAHAPTHAAVLDCCCGEGYYTHSLCQALEAAGNPPQMAAFDISRSGVKLASSRSDPTAYAVASVFRIPVAPESVDLALLCFAPFCGTEFDRILKPGGVLLHVLPGNRHLFGLKSALYDHPYENDEQGVSTDRLVERDRLRVSGTLHLTAAQAADLLAMTPYAYRTDPAAMARLRALPSLDTPFDFVIQVLQKRV